MSLPIAPWISRARVAPRAPLSAIAAAAVLALGCGSDPAESTALTAEAGFVQIDPVEYTLHGPTSSFLATSSQARLFFDFHPANETPEDKPLMVVYSGGPGASTGILLGGNTAPKTLDPARSGAGAADNSASWTAFANVLYIDARGTGFSYGVAPGIDVADFVQRRAEFTERNFNPYLDAADIVRTLLRFLEAHPALRSSRVVLAGESYGGERTEIALHLLHHPDRYEQGASLYVDAALVAEIRAHFAAAGTTAATQFDRAVLLQPRLFSPFQQAAAGAALEAKGSPLYSMGYIPCIQMSDPCSAYPNVVSFLQSTDRDLYDIRKPAGHELSRYASLGERIADPALLPDLIGTDPAQIDGLPAADRAAAYRVVDPETGDDPLAATLGAIPNYDRYFEMMLFDLIGAPFVSAKLKDLGLDRTDGHYGRLFLEDLLDAHMLITNAAFDAAIWTPSLPDAIAMYSSDVAAVHRGDESFTIDFATSAFGAPTGTSRSVRFPTYDASGHSIALDQPDKLAADIGAFLRDTE